VRQTGFLGDFADGGLLQALSLLDMTFGNGPTAKPVLDHEDLDAIVGGVTKDDPPSGIFTSSANVLRVFRTFRLAPGL
jgi:hypothetical protein